MMGKQKIQKKTDVLSASEIGHYQYCAYAWMLHRCGYKPESPHLELGRQVHVALGDTIDDLEARMRVARLYALLGIIILGVALLLIFFGVIL